MIYAFSLILGSAINLSVLKDDPQTNCIGEFEVEISNIKESEDYLDKLPICLTSNIDPSDPLNTWTDFQILSVKDRNGKTRGFGVGGEVIPPKEGSKEWTYRLNVSDWNRKVSDPSGSFTHAPTIASSELSSDASKITPQLSIGDDDDKNPVIHLRLNVSHTTRD